MNIDGGTRLLGVLGRGIRHSLSPRIQNHAIGELGENLVYVPFEISEEDLPDFLRLFPRFAGVGLNVTTPHKTAVARLTRPGDDEVAMTGVANTIVFRDGQAIGRATDGLGFRAWMAGGGIRPGTGGVLLLGFGAVARSIAYRLGPEFPLTVVSRDPAAAEAALQSWYAKGWTGLPSRAIAWSDPPPSMAMLVVSTLPVEEGRTRELASWLAGLDPSGTLVDLNYGAGRTPLRDQARDRGIAAHDGIGLLVHQAALSLSMWLGRTVSPALLAGGLPAGTI
jgi:shikimate dehydrogenase